MAILVVSLDPEEHPHLYPEMAGAPTGVRPPTHGVVEAPAPAMAGTAIGKRKTAGREFIKMAFSMSAQAEPGTPGGAQEPEESDQQLIASRPSSTSRIEAGRRALRRSQAPLAQDDARTPGSPAGHVRSCRRSQRRQLPSAVFDLDHVDLLLGGDGLLHQSAH